LHQATGLPKRGVFVNPGLYVQPKTRMPAVLAELGYLSNPRDAALLASEPQRFALGLYNGILEYFDRA
ncbi:MAG: N-acetylmuramoyl-L-alanine amidase, partial [Clostridia bacterium]|nr:N-acetylmuramoyl-L-alanine amidase [Clostridia bacterium]